MKRQEHGCTDSTNSCDRIINFNYQADDCSLQHLSAEEKACLTFLDDLIMSTVTEDGDLSCNDAQSSENTVSKNHQVTTCGVHQDGSSCTGILTELSAEEKACLKFLEETINSIEDGDLSTENAESAPESSYTTDKRHHINQMKKFLVPTAFSLATKNGSIPPKRGTASLKKKTPPNKDHSLQNDQPSGDASHWGSLSCDSLMGLCKRVSLLKTSFEKQPSTHGDRMNSKNPQNASERRCGKPNPPPVAPKPKVIPSHIASLIPNGTTISNPDSNMHSLSTSPDNCSGIRPDKTKLEALSKLGLLKEEAMPDKKKVCTLQSQASVQTHLRGTNWRSLE